MASTQGKADSNYYEITGQGQEENPPYIEVTADAEYMSAIPTAPPADDGLGRNIANQQLQGSVQPPTIQPGVYPQNQTAHQPQFQPQPSPYPPQHVLPPQQQMSPNQQYQPPPPGPAAYPPPPPYQQYDQMAGAPPPPSYQPLTTQPQPVPYPNTALQQHQVVVVHQPHQQQTQPVGAIVVTTRSNTGPTSQTYGIAITSIVLASIATCCLVGIFCTIPAIVFGALAMNSSTDTTKASSYAKLSMILTGVAWGMYVVFIVLAATL